jgi:hypothetical protein
MSGSSTHFWIAGPCWLSVQWPPCCCRGRRTQMAVSEMGMIAGAISPCTRP